MLCKRLSVSIFVILMCGAPRIKFDRFIAREFSQKRIAVFDGERLARADDAFILIAPHIRRRAESEYLSILQLVDLHVNPGKLPRVARYIDG